MTDQEVIDLYRYLLGRAPEDANTIKAFKLYYANVERGRKALFDSNEFQLFYARVTGRTAAGAGSEAADLALALLKRAGSAIPLPAVTAPRHAAIRAGLGSVIQRLGKVSLAVVVGETTRIGLDDLLPMQRQAAAVLHIAPGFPPAVPLTRALQDGVTLFQLGGDAGSIAAFLQENGQRIDALYLLDKPASLDWVDALRPLLAPRAFILVGPKSDGFDSARLGAGIAATTACEPMESWNGLGLYHVGDWLLPVTYTPPSAPPAPPDRAAYPRLAIAAIVRNEANCVENMLRSAAPVASFFAVLDTGSTDATASRAQAFLAACGVKFWFGQKSHTAFNNDFSAMRNAAIAMVPDWIDWVLMLDADEELVAEDYQPLLALIAAARYDAYAMPRYNFPRADKLGEMVSYPDRQVRLLRHETPARVVYSGAVHETVRDVTLGNPPLDSSAIGGARGGPHIHHLVRRFRTPEEEQRKQSFYKAIAERQSKT